jgi:pimeloyl-ACP methyl ester carboxylesterase
MGGGTKRQCDRALLQAVWDFRRLLGHRGKARARSHCRFVLPLIHFKPDSPRESVPLFLKRQCDRTLGKVVVVAHSYGTHLAMKLALRQTQAAAAAEAAGVPPASGERVMHHQLPDGDLVLSPG